jgi:hypothetical protein
MSWLALFAIYGLGVLVLNGVLVALYAWIEWNTDNLPIGICVFFIIVWPLTVGLVVPVGSLIGIYYLIFKWVKDIKKRRNKK